MHKILDMGRIDKPLIGGGFEFWWQSCEGTFLEENMIKRILPMISFWKLKKLDTMEFKRLLSIQGIIIYNAWVNYIYSPLIYLLPHSFHFGL